jgi:hypothetical protein
MRSFVVFALQNEHILYIPIVRNISDVIMKTPLNNLMEFVTWIRQLLTCLSALKP